VLQWLTPSHGVALAVYACYGVSMLLTLVLLSRVGDADRLLTDTLTDLRTLRPAAAARLLLAHLLLPIDKVPGLT